MATMGPLNMSISTLVYIQLSPRGTILTGNEAGVEGLASKVLVVLLKVLFGRGGELQGSELVAK